MLLVETNKEVYTEVFTYDMCNIELYVHRSLRLESTYTGTWTHAKEKYKHILTSIYDIHLSFSLC